MTFVESALTEGLAVGALVHGGVCFVGAHQDPVQGAVVLGVAVICAGLYGAFDALVGMMIHLSSSFLFGAKVVWADFGFPYIPVAFWEILCYCDCRINCCLHDERSTAP